jgi:hypothetical protein
MQLPPKALNVLANIKAELLSRQELTPLESAPSVIITLSRPKTEPKVTVFMRHARNRGQAFQRMCRNREF